MKKLDPAAVWPFPSKKPQTLGVDHGVEVFLEGDEKPNALTPPKLGQYWPGQGGIFIGQITTPGDGPDDYLVMASAEHGEHADTEWGKYRTAIDSCDNANDGRPNTAAMAATGLPLGEWALGLDIEGFKDWHLPAQDELALMYINGRQLCDKACYWSSTQCSASLAWYQYFAHGTQVTWGKVSELRARAVRRFSPIQ